MQQRTTSGDRDPLIVSWTLAGHETAHIIGDALKSVEHLVHGSVVVDTADDPLPWTLPNGKNVAVVRWRWRHDFAAARNAALDIVGAEFFATWSAMVDTDERVACPDPAAFRAWLAALPDHVQVVLVHHVDGSHTRERFFRMPAKYRFVGKTHEMLPCPTTEQAIAPRELIQWTELPKTEEQLRAKFARDVEMLRADLRENPANGAACHYLGISLQSLALYARADGDESRARELLDEALEAYREHRRLDVGGSPAWHEGTAWSCYRAAECYLALEQPDRALDAVAAGLVLDAGIAELHWIASIASLQVGRLEQARCWAEQAKAHALGSDAERRRVGFRVPRGLGPGPDEVLAFVRSAMETVHAAVP